VLATTALSVAFVTQPAFGDDAPVIVPTRLDFDASHASKKCNDPDGFLLILGAWVPQTTMRDDAERRLVVRIRSSSTGGKRADVSLVDAQGVTVAERHTPYAATAECYKVLWDAAFDAAELLGAFEPPPPMEPVTYPAPAQCPSYPLARPCPTCPSPVPPAPTITLSPTPSRFFIGIGGFVGSGIYSELDFGPYLLLGFVPSPRLSHLQLEFEGAWTSQTSLSAMTSESIHAHSIPLVLSLCLVRGIVRFCGGLATTIFSSNQSSPNDELRLLFGGNFRVGTELFVRGPISIRADVFARFAFAERRFGMATMTVDDPTPFAAGLAVMGARLFD
jgi:hypothetical protein